MRSQIIVGVVVFAAIVLGGLAAPLLRGSSAQADELARRTAETTRRALADAGSNVSTVSKSDLAALQKSDVQKLAERAKASDPEQAGFDRLGSEFRQWVDRAINRDRTFAGRGMPTSLKGFAGGNSGVKSAIDQVARLLSDADKALLASDKDLKALSGEARDFPLVSQVLGMVHELRASLLLTDSQHVRRRLALARSHLIGLGIEMRAARAEADRYAGFDVADTVRDLQKSLEEIQRKAGEARQQVETLTMAVAEREADLAKVREELLAAKNELLTLEEMSFTAGNDAEFGAYRARHTELSHKVETLQQRESETAFGGLIGVEFASDETLDAAIRGGEARLSLDELKWRLAQVKDEVAGLERAADTSTQHIAHVQQMGQSATDATDMFAKRMDDLRQRIDEARKQVGELAGDAYKIEDDALKAAAAAVSAFEASERAFANRKRAAEITRNDVDPNKQNERLKRMAGDEFIERIGSSARAEARLLQGRIHAQRAEDIAEHLAVFERLVTLLPGTQFEAGPFETALATARTEGKSALDAACEAFNKLLKGPSAVAWVPQAALGPAFHLLARVDPPNANAHLAAALDAVSKAVDGRERSPYLSAHVVFKAALQKRVTPAEPKGDEGAEPAEGDAEANGTKGGG
ncbi:MAG: hypothetical protein CHACPFDD_02477 [Phycisphaerae bacterium]|nr:hypothetical protein [Phycisphaerae bacterium]